jgi:hypothetical protein
MRFTPKGWQRWWVVISAAWTLVVVAIVYSLWPASLLSTDPYATSPRRFSFVGELAEYNPLLSNQAGALGSTPPAAGSTPVPDDPKQAAVPRGTPRPPDHDAAGRPVSPVDDDVAFKILDPLVDVPPEVKAQAWDAFHQALETDPRTGTRLEQQLAALLLPREAIAKLLDAKLAAAQETANVNRVIHRAFVEKMLVTWTIPVIVLYAIGWTIGWVRRGFAG